ncbi:enoyl-CoA hydratase/isomerase family protein [Candidatus Odyssella thessalonicensis]|uniref:enoyl-CoA hydratase/isomerase family protein n=1 Tax=Candidatus Odyssella thessalonicensis TaxID=84647 RepID=UPI000225BDA1|nr:enoyl-CoA hydratase/isomerase family protein [Candidatus Odyssella thessalonicensis]
MEAVARLEDIESEVLISTQGNAGIITLNRPKALNSLNLTMIREIHKALKQWQQDDAIACVIVEGVGEKAFCAGGDIRSVYQARLEGNRDYNDAIFREEYQLNYYISQYPKPYISLIDGICMGGGLGISAHGSHRIVTERTVMAMPETTIGFFPDVGASYFLNQCPGYIGMFLAITGEKISGEDAIYCGIATHYLSSTKMADLRLALTQAQSTVEIDAILTSVNEVAAIATLSTHQQLIDDIFGQSSLHEILAKLYQSENAKAYEWARNLSKKCPLSMAITFTLLQNNKGLSLKQCLPVEFRLSQSFVDNYNFFEGIRALLIDKDNEPKWQPSHISQVDDIEVKAYFKELGAKELILI